MNETQRVEPFARSDKAGDRLGGPNSRVVARVEHGESRKSADVRRDVRVLVLLESAVAAARDVHFPVQELARQLVPRRVDEHAAVVEREALVMRFARVDGIRFP